MKADKVTVIIEIETLDIDAVPAMIEKVRAAIDNQAEEGSITMCDGDGAKWTTKRKTVEF